MRLSLASSLEYLDVIGVFYLFMNSHSFIKVGYSPCFQVNRTKKKLLDNFWSWILSLLQLIVKTWKVLDITSYWIFGLSLKIRSYLVWNSPLVKCIGKCSIYTSEQFCIYSIPIATADRNIFSMMKLLNTIWSRILLGSKTVNNKPQIVSKKCIL